VIALAGAGVGGFMMMPDILISFTIDADELKTGVRREGAYFGFNAFVMRFAVVAQAWTYALILYASGFDEELPVQTDAALFALRLLLAVVPFLAILLGAAVISKYPYHGSTLDQLQKETEALHEQKRSALPAETPPQ
jgi:GPH family glycoside/pentoside/hexuronide:cation symporter